MPELTADGGMIGDELVVVEEVSVVPVVQPVRAATPIKNRLRVENIFISIPGFCCEVLYQESADNHMIPPAKISMNFNI